MKEVNDAQEQANPPDNKAGVNLLHGVKVYAQKRGRQQLSENGSAVAAAAVQKKKGRVDGGANDKQDTGGANGAGGVTGGNPVQAAQTHMTDVDQRVPTEEIKPKKKRHVRKLVVTLPQKDVWERLMQGCLWLIGCHCQNMLPKMCKMVFAIGMVVSQEE